MNTDNMQEEYDKLKIQEASERLLEPDDNPVDSTIEDPINPSYYKKGGIECIDAMISAFGKEAVAAFCKCNVFKYTYRSPNKQSVESIKKAEWYLNKYMSIAPEFSEVWKLHSNGLYEVSNLGNIRRAGNQSNRKKITLKNGYDTVMFSVDGKVSCHYIHRLVAEAFLSNPHNYSEINHKNHIRTDNRVENLEWCNRKYNVQEAIGQPVWAYNTDGDLLEKFNSIRDCESFFGFGHKSISVYVDSDIPRGNILMYTKELSTEELLRKPWNVNKIIKTEIQ